MLLLFVWCGRVKSLTMKICEVIIKYLFVSGGGRRGGGMDRGRGGGGRGGGGYGGGGGGGGYGGRGGGRGGRGGGPMRG